MVGRVRLTAFQKPFAISSPTGTIRPTMGRRDLRQVSTEHTVSN